MTELQDHPGIERLPLETLGIPVRETVREIFRDPENGTPENISKAGCLALTNASNSVACPGLGHVVWNSWRNFFPAHSAFINITNFENHEFTHDVNFSGFELGDYANFRKAIFRRRAFFKLAFLGNSTDFSYSFWGGSVYFDFSKWAHGVLFQSCYFAQGASFLGVQGLSGSFVSSISMSSITFCGASWSDNISFSGSVFHGGFDASGTSWSWLQTRFYFGSEYFQTLKKYAESIGTSPDSFEWIDCSGVEFHRWVDLSNRKFGRRTSFDNLESHNPFSIISRDSSGLPVIDDKGNIQHVEYDTERDIAMFHAPPIFHGSEFHQDTSFEGAKFPEATGSEKAARAYRTLKLAFSKQQAIREEQRFFRLEMEEETLRETGLKRWLFWAYKTFSDYGFSVTRPLTYGVSALLVLTLIYGLLSWAGQCGFSFGASCRFSPRLLEFSLLQTFPLPGLDKLSDAAKAVFWPQGAWWGLGLSVLVIVHKTVSLAALFLIGLAFRNLLKLN